MSSISHLTIRAYDEYLIKKIESVIMKDAQNKPVLDVVYSPFELAFEYAMKRQQVVVRNQIRFPLISCHRSAGFTISDMTHRVLNTKVPVYYVNYLDETQTRISRYIQTINVNIPYNIEILTKEEDQAFLLAQELIFLFVREPFVEVPQYVAAANVPTINKTNFKFAVMLDNDIADNTDLEAEADIGKMYRLTLSLVINDAALTRDVDANLVTEAMVEIIYPQDNIDVTDEYAINFTNP